MAKHHTAKNGNGAHLGFGAKQFKAADQLRGSVSLSLTPISQKYQYT